MGEVEASLSIVVLLSTYYVVTNVVGEFFDLCLSYFSREE